MRICKSILDLHEISTIISLYFRRKIQWEIVFLENISNTLRETSNKIASKGEMTPPKERKNWMQFYITFTLEINSTI